MPLKDEHVNILKKPFGKLIKQEQISKEKIKSLVKDSKSLITVGDATTETIISFGLTPNLSIIDGVEKRIRRTESKMLELKNFFITSTCKFNQYECKNPKGTISKEAYLNIKKILLKGEQAIIFIDGEEDMLALPVFALAPINSVVFYGQPLEGLVSVKINDKIKNKSRHLIDSIGLE
ncbi:MAG: GTP-dependent dephospho-CoA kinase family protein [Nitrososphaeraceae archaeon]